MEGRREHGRAKGGNKLACCRRSWCGDGGTSDRVGMWMRESVAGADEGG